MEKDSNALAFLSIHANRTTEPGYLLEEGS
jgi:hypothetical protein